MTLFRWVGVFVLLTISACTPGYINTENLGPASTPAEVVAHYSGKSIMLTDSEGSFESYYGADGTWKAVGSKAPFFGTGTWKVRAFAGANQIVILANGKELIDGQWKPTGSLNLTGVVYIQPDGSAVVDQFGSGNRTQSKPTPGFQYQNRYNSLKKSAGS